jgi:hypothetical protein
LKSVLGFKFGSDNFGTVGLGTWNLVWR